MRLAFVFFVLLSFSPLARSWSEFGHRLVGELAYRQLSPSARAQVDALLQGEPEPTLAGVAPWADTIRDLPAFEDTGPLHYVRINDAACVFERARDCRGDACVVGAIERYRRVLADRSLPRGARAEALKFVVHFVGDAHQPLHAGHRGDRGGNEFQLNLRGEGTNLHAVWDYHVLRSADLDSGQWIARLAATPAVPSGDAPAQWAEASCRMTNAPGFYPRRPGKLPPAYLAQHLGQAEARLRQAAAELAALLEAALAR